MSNVKAALVKALAAFGKRDSVDSFYLCIGSKRAHHVEVIHIDRETVTIVDGKRVKS